MLSMKRIIEIFFIIIPLALLAACANENTAIIRTKDGREYKFNIEIMDSPEERARGMMFRQEIDPDFGMLFDFFEERQVAFWMQNTFVPLDMIFISADGEIKNIFVNARPLDTSSIPSNGPVRFVLEVAGNRTLELGISKGDRLEHPRVQKTEAQK